MEEREIIKNIIATASRAASRLHELARPVWRVLSFSAADERISPKRDLCISIEKAGVSAAFGTRSLSRTSIKGAKSYHTAGPDYPLPKDAASSALLAVREFGAAGADITLSIPKSWVIIKTAELPLSVRENLPGVVAYEFDRLMPMSPDEALYDFRVLRENSEKITIVITAAKADLVNRYIEALGEKGIRVGRVSVNLLGIGALCRFANKDREQLFLEVKEDGYEGGLFAGGILAGTFSGVFGSSDDRKKIDELENAIRPLLDEAKGRGSSPRICALLKGRTASLKEMLRARLGLPVLLLDEAGGKPGAPGQQKDIPYAAVGGAIESLRPKAGGINMLKKGRHEKAKTPLSSTLVLSGLLFLIWIVRLVAPLRIEEERLRYIEGQIKLRKGSVRDIETLRKEMDLVGSETGTINKFMEKRTLALAVLKELTILLPKSAWLTRLKVTETAVEIEGYASSATDLLPRLESSRLFGKAEFASQTFRDTRTNSDRFNIKMKIKGTKGDKEEALKDGKR